MTNYKPQHRETVNRPINHGDPDAVTQCPGCRIFYRNGQPYERQRGWRLRMLVENWWRYGWEIKIEHGSTFPIGYGLSWHAYNDDRLVVHPLPFNVVMRTLREWFIWMVQGGWRKFPTKQDEIDMRVAKKTQQLTRVVGVPTPEEYFRQQYGITPEKAWAQKIMIGPVDMCNFVHEYVDLVRGKR
jgi:hypothetical protein